MIDLPLFRLTGLLRVSRSGVENPNTAVERGKKGSEFELSSKCRILNTCETMTIPKINLILNASDLITMKTKTPR